ncbi:hypothetical protein BRD14_05075 [Halobacteriales archaeon SW_5_68_122]|nr:MAG: hypothetical protein BRD14_05075 [Halobacteriales archaeon SW_5_68_122]
MDTEIITESLGESGLVGVATVVVGILILARENRRAAVGAIAVVVGYALVGHGLMESFLRSMGMEYEDLF